MCIYIYTYIYIYNIRYFCMYDGPCPSGGGCVDTGIILLLFLGHKPISIFIIPPCSTS